MRVVLSDERELICRFITIDLFLLHLHFDLRRLRLLHLLLALIHMLNILLGSAYHHNFAALPCLWNMLRACLQKMYSVALFF